jgi:hypothetical protein
MAERGWQRPFDEPIPLPRGRALVTLKDAGKFITKLPKAEHETPEWQAAAQALLLVAERGGPTMLARIGIMRALHRHDVQEFTSDRKPHHWGKRKLKRDEQPIALRNSRIAAGASLPGRLSDTGHGGKPNPEGRQVASGTISLAFD